MNDVVEIINVEGDNFYQRNGIDLLCKTDNGRGLWTSTAEVKTTRYPEEYYFIETISNTNKNTPGSFLTSQAEDILFYFINCNKLHKIKTHDFILWFLKYQGDFQTKITHTRDYFGNILYTTAGKLVPCNRVAEELNLQIFNLN